MVKGLVIKMFDQPVEIIFHLQIDDDIGILFEVHRLHLKDFLPQRFQFPQRFRQAFYFLPDSGCLLRQDIGDFSRGIEGNEPVLYVIQREP